VNPVLFRPLPFPQADRLVALAQYHRTSGSDYNFSLPTFKDYLAQQKSLEAVSAFTQGRSAVTTPSEVVRLRSLYASPGLFGVLKLEPELGRTLVEADDSAVAPPVVVLSRWAWQRHFAGDATVVGRAVNIDGKSFTVVGVMPELFKLPGQSRSAAVIFPLSANPDVQKFGGRRGHHNLIAIGRLKPGVSFEAATAESEPIFAAIEQADSGESNLRLKFIDLKERVTEELRPAALVLFAAVLLVLLIACANVAGLLVVRAGARQREIAIRLALGASRGRLVRQVLTESVLLGVLGAGLGLLVALWTFDGLKALIGSRIFDMGLDSTTLALTAAAGVLTGLVFGAVPALHATRVGVHEVLKDAGNRATLSRGRRRLQAGLIAVQVSLAFALLAGAGLMFRSLHALLDESPGFDAAQVVSIKLPLPEWSYPLEHRRAFYRRAIEEAKGLPGVVSAATGDPFPFLDGNSRNSVYRPEAPPQKGDEVSANMYEVSEGYFETMGIPLLEGRTFSPQERERGQAVVISKKTAERFWPGESPLGRKLHAGQEGDSEVVGVVGDVKHGSLAGGTKMAIYHPFEQSQWMDQSLVVKVKGDPEAQVDALRRFARGLDPSLPAPEPEPAVSILEESESSRRLTLVMLATFAGLALLLSAMGLWGLIAYAVGQRRQELAIRRALGAPDGHLVGLVLRQGLWLVGLGLLGGVALALAGSRVLRALLYGVQATDPITYLAIGAVLGTVALVACWLPARSATRVDPNGALRA
jgi:putative ABC transport system permease protein